MNPTKSPVNLLLLLVLLFWSGSGGAQVHLWLTDPDKSIFLKDQTASMPFGGATNENATIDVDEDETFQTIDGFGCCLTGGSATHLIEMNPANRAALLEELFTTDGSNIGISYLRVSIGASDLNDHPYSYDDLPAGQTDTNMMKFSLAPDDATVIPVLKEILAVNPDIKILGSPWSSPPWMKDTNDTRGGSLKREFYDAYARYFIKYIEGMKAEGIGIDAITIQNEPLNAKNNPSMQMSAREEADFIKNSLGPAFHTAGIDTKIIIYDHNCDHPEYPISMLNDPEVKKYVDGSAFHLYASKISALSEVHNAHPDKALYFTEQWMNADSNFKRSFDQHIRNLVIGATRNWSRNVLEWNLDSDSNYQPHTDRGGCDRCQGAITIDGNKVTRNAGYYVMAHGAKFVRPGSIRIGSNYLPTLPNVAFKAPDGQKILLVLNNGQSPRTFNIRYRG
ncbi:MAG TPA: glycoside hydrolase family 30 beta sandwich domain-containing protein, partial [Candidatus Saccharimonadales bacterium]|nr:glycoside hydrolase family 30 beta sandwich domain-containing protein [Candidatus Saccharimonadales bacterium]